MRLSVPQGGVVSRVMVDVGARLPRARRFWRSIRFAKLPMQRRIGTNSSRRKTKRPDAESAAIFEAAAANIRQSLASQQQVLDLTTQQARRCAGFEGGAVSLFEVQTKDREVAEVHARIAQQFGS